MKQPTTGSVCPEIYSLPEYLQDILKELYQHSQVEGYPEIFLDACKKLKEIIPEVECPHIPYTIAWQLWFRGFTRGFTESYISTVVNEEVREKGKLEAIQEIARTMLKNGFDHTSVMKMTGLTVDELEQIHH
ncbi:hypothetical protein GUP44_003740 [Salmonella enterica]|nr:hypothetical protein [Salmonella enterica]